MNALLEKIIIAASKNDLTTFEGLIKENLAELSKRDEQGRTFLHIIAHFKWAPAITWVCQNATLLNLSFNDTDNHGQTALTTAYETNNQQAIAILQPYTPNYNYEKWLVLKQLVCVYGNNLLLKNHIKIDKTLKSSAKGGWTADSLQILNAAIVKFIDSKNTDQKKTYTNILITLRNFYSNLKNYRAISSENDTKTFIDELINKANTRKAYFYSGFTGHGFTASLKKNDSSTYELSLYDENKINTNLTGILNFAFLGEAQFVRRAIISKEKIATLISFLIGSEKIKEKEFYEALRKILKKSHATVNYDSYFFESIKSAEEDRCYWMNTLHATNDMFIDQFGKEKGHDEFNEFSKFIHQEVLEHFKSTFQNECNKEAVDKLEEIQNKKEIKHFWTPSRKRYAMVGLIILSLTISTFLLTSGFGIPLVAPLFIGLDAAVGSMGASLILMSASLLSMLSVPFYNVIKFFSHVNQTPSKNSNIPLTIQPEIPEVTQSSYNIINNNFPPTQQIASKEKIENPTSENLMKTQTSHSIATLFSHPKPNIQINKSKEEVNNALWHIPSTVAY